MRHTYRDGARRDGASRLAPMLCGSLALFAALSVRALPIDRHPGPRRAEMVDHRYYRHGPFDPRRRAFVRALPRGYRPYSYGGRRLYFYDGTWYAPSPGGFVIVPPPAGLYVSVLPRYHSAVWLGGNPDSNGSENLYVYVYAKDGQSSVKQETDRYECAAWSSQQSGFDPMQPGGGVAPEQNNPKSAQYDRALSSCLEGRGYNVR
jgi:hypothetical protein